MNARDLPYGAREIAELRLIGKRPADLILVSFVGPLREPNPVIVAKPGRTYDWRVLVGLSVAVVVGAVRIPRTERLRCALLQPFIGFRIQRERYPKSGSCDLDPSLKVLVLSHGDHQDGEFLLFNKPSF